MRAKWLIVIVAFLAVSGAAAILVPRQHVDWSVGTGPGLVLSLKGEADNLKEAATLEIRCDGAAHEVRVYAPIGVTTIGSGMNPGPAKLPLQEAFYDKNRKPLPVSEEDRDYGYDWTVDPSGNYAVMPSPEDFLARIKNRDWLALNAAAYGTPPAGIHMMFPVMGFGSHAAEVKSACGV
jgi:hypothetical protein